MGWLGYSRRKSDNKKKDTKARIGPQNREAAGGREISMQQLANKEAGKGSKGARRDHHLRH
jgi:hypothetical protein